MASGSFPVTTTNEHISGAVTWSSTPNTAGNYSDVTATLRLSRTNTGFTTEGRGSFTISIGGNSKTNDNGNNQFVFTYNSNTFCVSHTVRIYHNDNGSGSVYISVSGGISRFTVKSTGKTVSLDTIPRYAKITSFTASNITRNSFKLNYAVDRAISGVQYQIGSGTWYNLPSDGVITGQPANAVISVRISVKNAASGLWTNSDYISVALTKTAIPNTPTLSSITCIQAVLNWTASQTVSEIQYNINGGAWINPGIYYGAATSGVFEITGLSPGTEYRIHIRVRDSVHGTWSGGSGARYITTVALSTAATPNFNLESSLPVAISRPNANLVHDVYMEVWYDSKVNSVAHNVLSNIGTSATLTPTTAAVNTIFSKRPTSNFAEVRLRVVSRWGANGTIQGTTYTAWGKANIVNANPSIASVTYKDINSTIQAILDNDQKILRNKSNLQVTAGLAKSQKGASLASYKVTIGGNEYSASASGTEQDGRVIGVGLVNQAANQTAVLTVIDSRGNTASIGFTVQMLDYAAPQFIQASADRLNNYEEPTDMNIEARRAVVKPGTVDVNEIYLRYRIRENPSGSYGNWVDLTRQNSYINGIWQNVTVAQYMADYPNNKSYTVEVGISDKFTDWDTILVPLLEGIALLRYLQDRIEAGVPIMDQETGQPYIFFAESEEW